MEMEVVALQLKKMLVRSRTASSCQYRSCCTLCGQPASAAGGPVRLDELRV